MSTFGAVLAREGVSAVGALDEIEVPVLGAPQRQGDVGVFAAPPRLDRGTLVGAEGVVVVAGEATGNTHVLHADGRVWWAPVVDELVLGRVVVEPGATGWLIHTDEHGVNGLLPGCYELRGKREQADVVRRVAD